MKLFDSLSPVFDPARMLRASRIRIGSLRMQGVPAILVGVSCVVVAGGIARALARITPALPDAVREARGFWEAVRPDRPPLNP